MKKRRNWAPFLLILPSVIYLAIFFAWPMFRAMTLAVWDESAALRLHEEADADSRATGTLPTGTQVQVLDRQGNVLEGEALGASNLQTERWFAIQGADSNGQPVAGWAQETRVRVREQDASGKPLAGTIRRGRTRPVLDLRLPAYALLVWESLVVLSGGSYWLHYLMGLVPGFALLAAAAVQRPVTSRRPLQIAYGLAAVSTACTLVWVAADPIDRPEAPAVAYLDEHARAGDTAIVAFGGANILRSTGLHSPYPDLWSLPVRVHDPDLRLLSRILAGPDRPTWLVVAGTSLATWGIDATTADTYLRDDYTPVATAGDFTIFRSNER